MDRVARSTNTDDEQGWRGRQQQTSPKPSKFVSNRRRRQDRARLKPRSGLLWANSSRGLGRRRVGRVRCGKRPMVVEVYLPPPPLTKGDVGR
jgi:hypothetical protein